MSIIKNLKPEGKMNFSPGKWFFGGKPNDSKNILPFPGWISNH